MKRMEEIVKGAISVLFKGDKEFAFLIDDILGYKKFVPIGFQTTIKTQVTTKRGTFKKDIKAKLLVFLTLRLADESKKFKNLTGEEIIKFLVNKILSMTEKEKKELKRLLRAKTTKEEVDDLDIIKYIVGKSIDVLILGYKWFDIGRKLRLLNKWEEITKKEGDEEEKYKELKLPDEEIFEQLKPKEDVPKEENVVEKLKNTMKKMVDEINKLFKNAPVVPVSQTDIEKFLKKQKIVKKYLEKIEESPAKISISRFSEKLHDLLKKASSSVRVSDQPVQIIGQIELSEWKDHRNRIMEPSFTPRVKEMLSIWKDEKFESREEIIDSLERAIAGTGMGTQKQVGRNGVPSSSSYPQNIFSLRSQESWEINIIEKIQLPVNISSLIIKPMKADRVIEFFKSFDDKEVINIKDVIPREVYLGIIKEEDFNNIFKDFANSLGLSLGGDWDSNKEKFLNAFKNPKIEGGMAGKYFSILSKYTKELVIFFFSLPMRIDRRPGYEGGELVPAIQDVLGKVVKIYGFNLEQKTNDKYALGPFILSIEIPDDKAMKYIIKGNIEDVFREIDNMLEEKRFSEKFRSEYNRWLQLINSINSEIKRILLKR